MKQIFTLISALLIPFIVSAQKYDHTNVPDGKENLEQQHKSPSEITKNDRGTAVQKKPLHEVFTSSTCGYCPPANSNIDGIVLTPANKDDCTLIKYQVSWPGSGDPYNTPDVQARKNYYNVTGVPSFYVDANSESGTNYNQYKLNNYKSVDAYFTIDAEHTIIGDSVFMEVIINPEMDWYGMCRVAIVEKTTYGNATSNGETEFHNVLMKMVPSPNGTFVNLTDGIADTLNLSADMSNTFVEEMSDLEVVVFLQDNTSKEVMQSDYSEMYFSVEDLIMNEVYLTENNSDCNLDTTENLKAKFVNYGGDTLYNINAYYSINGGSVVTETVSGPIMPADTFTYTFTNALDLTSKGIYSITAGVDYTNDYDTTNNEMSTIAISGDNEMTLDIKTDDYPGETSWEIVEKTSGKIVASGGDYGNDNSTYSESFCIIDSLCYEFTIYDEYGDGMCCDHGNGYYKLYKDGSLLKSGGDFNDYEITDVDASFDISLNDITVCEGDLVMWDTTGYGSYSHIPSDIDNTVSGQTDVTYSINPGSPCSNTKTFTVTVVNDSIDISTNNISLCKGEPFSLPSGKGIFNPSSVDNNIVDTTNVTYTVNQGMSCENTTSFDVYVNPLPSIDIGCIDTSFCINSSVDLPSGSGTYFPLTIDSTVAGITNVKYKMPDNSYGCSDSCTFDVEIIDNTIDINSSDIIVCQGENITFPSGKGTYTPANVNNSVVDTTNVTYTVSAGTKCENSVSFDVIVNPTPALDINCQDTSYCIYSTINLSGSGSYTPATIDNSTEGVTNIKYTTTQNSYGCSDSCTFDVEIIDSTLDVSPLNDMDYCQGDTINFPSGNGVYDPANIDNSVTGATTVTYTVADGTACENYFTFDVTVNKQPEAVITENPGFVLTTDTDYDLQWYLNDTAIQGATDTSYTCTEDGDYYIIVSTPEGCTEKSNVINVSGTIVEDHSKLEFSLFPNPADQIVYIEFPDEKADINVYDITGKLILQKEDFSNEIIDISTFGQGVYTIEIITDKGIGYKKLLVK